MACIRHWDTASTPRSRTSPFTGHPRFRASRLETMWFSSNQEGKQAMAPADSISRFVLPPLQGTLMNTIEMLCNILYKHRERQR